MIRWAQASALMPLIQFSIGPWHFDEETVRSYQQPRWLGCSGATVGAGPASAVLLPDTSCALRAQ